MNQKKKPVKKSKLKKGKIYPKRRDFFKEESVASIRKKRNEVELIERLEKIKKDNAKKMGLLKDIEKEDIKRKEERKRKMIESKSRIPGEDLFEIKTDYDRVLEEVNVKGDVSASTLMKELNMKKDEFFYCYTILSDRKLIKLDYPVVGKLHLVSLNYHEEKKKEKKEKKEEKKNQKRENKNKGEKNE